MKSNRGFTELKSNQIFFCTREKLKSNQKMDQSNPKCLQSEFQIVFKTIILLVILAICSIFKKKIIILKHTSLNHDYHNIVSCHYNNKKQDFSTQFIIFQSLVFTTLVPFPSLGQKVFAVKHTGMYITRASVIELGPQCKSRNNINEVNYWLKRFMQFEVKNQSQIKSVSIFKSN